MQDYRLPSHPTKRPLGHAEWRNALSDNLGETGFFQTLGRDHVAIFVDAGRTLLVSFETRQGIQSLSAADQPLGFEMVRKSGWSNLTLVSDGDTWFRADEVFAFFDKLDDDGFFDDFDHVVFYGAGPCAYAAAAFARAAQDATIVAIQPQATLTPRITGWDERFTEYRSHSFEGPYGYAPDFLELSSEAFILFDPRQKLDAMHAALFRSMKTRNLRMPFMGAVLQSTLLEMDILFDLLERAGSGELTPQWFHAQMRARRDYPPYLRNLMSVLERDARFGLLKLLCLNVSARLEAPRFERKLTELRAG